VQAKYRDYIKQEEFKVLIALFIHICVCVCVCVCGRKATVQLKFGVLVCNTSQVHLIRTNKGP